MEGLLIVLGLGIAGCTLAAILWSITVPSRRIWPPRRFEQLTLLFVWGPTFALFGILIVLGISGWGEFEIAQWLRYGVGIPMIVLSNVAVWYEVSHFGIAQTSGSEGTLRTVGLYRYSRNPQYVADTIMVFGWCLLSAASGAMIVGMAGIIVLLAAPFAEEGWMRERYGSDYDAYASRVRRFV